MSAPRHVIPLDRLPEGFARRISQPPAVPAEARPAATIVLLRDAEEGVEVLLMRRSRRAGFVPGAFVFPGGRVDTADAEPELLELVDGLTPDAAERRLDLRGAHPPAISYYVAALREAFEETGLLVAHSRPGEPVASASADPRVEALRVDLLEDRVTFAEVLRELGCRIDATAVEYCAHWITPVVEPRRYDTRFFAARVPAGSEAVVDRREMTEALWIRPAEALRRQAEGSLPMVFPTIHTLEDLAAYASVAEALQDLSVRAVPAILPRLVVTPRGVGTVID